MPQLGLGSSLSRGGVLSGFENKYSLEFDGTDDYVDCGSDSSLDNIFNGGGTVSAWIYPESIGETEARLLDKRTNGTGWTLHLLSGEPGVGCALKLFHNYDGDDGTYTTTNRDITYNQWTHVAIVYDTSGYGASYQAIIYINGSSVALTIVNSTGTVDTDAPNALLIGNTGDQGRTFDGLIDEVAIWDVALDADAVSAIYNSGTPIALDADSGDYDNSGDLQGWWRMGDGDLDDGNIAGNGLIGDQTNATLGSELLATTGWTLESVWTLSGGVLTFDDAGNGRAKLLAANMTNGTGMAIGKVYKLQYTISNLSSGTADIRIDDEDGNLQIAEVSEANGSYTKYFSATNDGKGLAFVALAAGDGSFDISSYSLKQVNGNPGIMTNMTASDIVEDTP